MIAPLHLQHLPTDQVGRPVPYINIWGPPDIAERMRLKYDRHVRDIAVYYDDQPGGEPDFTRQSMQRQRELMVVGKCQVCARLVPWSDRKLVLSPVTTHTVEWVNGPVQVVHEPWLCPDCAEFAVQVCPSLIRRRRDEQLTVYNVAEPKQVIMIESRGWIEGPHEEATKRNPVVMWVKLILPAGVLDVDSRYAAAVPA